MQLTENKKPRSKDIRRLFELTQDKEKMKARRAQYAVLQEQLKQSPDTQISTIDPECRAIPHKTNVIEVYYSTQVATDEKHSLVVHFEVTNENNRKALHPTAMAVKEALGLPKETKLKALADKRYFNAEQLDACQKDGVIKYVPQTYNRAEAAIPVKGYHLEDFRYHSTTDTYTCPEGHTLTTNGHWYIKVYTRSERQRALPGSSTTKQTSVSAAR